MAGPRSFPTGTLIIPSGTSATTLVLGAPGQIASVVNGATGSSVGVSIYNSATVGAIGAPNRILNAVVLTGGQSLPVNVYCSAGIVIQFASAITDNITVTFQSLANSA